MRIEGRTCDRRLSRDVVCDGEVQSRKTGWQCNKCGAFQSYDNPSRDWSWATPRHILKLMETEG